MTPNRCHANGCTQNLICFCFDAVPCQFLSQILQALSSRFERCHFLFFFLISMDPEDQDSELFTMLLLLEHRRGTIDGAELLPVAHHCSCRGGRKDWFTKAESPSTDPLWSSTKLFSVLLSFFSFLEKLIGLHWQQH